MKHSCSLLNSAFRTSKYELLLKTKEKISLAGISILCMEMSCYTQNIQKNMFKKCIFLSVGIICPSPWLMTALPISQLHIHMYLSEHAVLPHTRSGVIQAHNEKYDTKYKNQVGIKAGFHLAFGLLHICHLLSGH